MKTITLLNLFLLFTSQLLFAQKKMEILIVGSSHENKPGVENYEMVIGKLKSFNPDMVFGEYLSPEDYDALAPGTYAFGGMKKAQALIARSYPLPVKNLGKKITAANKSLNNFTYLHKLRMDLAGYYVMQRDRANAEYQIYLIEHHMKKAFGKQELAYYTEHFGNRDSLQKARLYRPLSEYTNIYFPLLFALKQDKLYAMDCQRYDGAWSAAWGRADSVFEILRAKAKDTSSAEAKTLAAIEQYSNLTAEDKKMMTSSSYYNMSHDRYSELNDAWNFYGGSHFYGWAGFPDQEVKDMFAQWTLRNEGMCANVLRQAKAKKASRVVVGVGAAHRKIMEDILSRDPDVKIVSYKDLL